MKPAALSVAVFLVASSAFAQDNAQGFGQKLGTQEVTPPGGRTSMGELLSKGYEIRAAVPNGKKFVVFLQKDQSAYACEMQSLTASQCGTLN